MKVNSILYDYRELLRFNKYAQVHPKRADTSLELGKASTFCVAFCNLFLGDQTDMNYYNVIKLFARLVPLFMAATRILSRRDI